MTSTPNSIQHESGRGVPSRKIHGQNMNIVWGKQPLYTGGKLFGVGIAVSRAYVSKIPPFLAARYEIRSKPQ